MSDSNFQNLYSMEMSIIEMSFKHKNLAARIAYLDADAINTLGEEISYINREHKRLRDLESLPTDCEYAYRSEDIALLTERVSLAMSTTDELLFAVRGQQLAHNGAKLATENHIR